MARVMSSTASTVSPRTNDPSGLRPSMQPASIRTPSRAADRLTAVPHPTEVHRRPPSASSRQFQALFDSLFKVLFIFPSRYLFAIGLSPIFSLGRNLPPDWGLHSQTTRLVDSASWCDRVRAGRGSHPPRRPFPGDLGPVRR
ncbi:unnamed protein product [Musa hybrid cultivar]